MKIGSHNSWSFRPVAEWYLKPFFWVARCQKLDIRGQLERGVRCFDLRLKYKDDRMRLSHGLVTFKGMYYNDLLMLDKEAARLQETIYCRVLMEDSNYGPLAQEEVFAKECRVLELSYTHIVFFGGWPRSRYMKPIYHFPTEGPSLDDKYGSVTPKWKCLPWPWIYAKLNNKENRRNGTDKEFLFIDYINL